MKIMTVAGIVWNCYFFCQFFSNYCIIFVKHVYNLSCIFHYFAVCVVFVFFCFKYFINSILLILSVFIIIYFFFIVIIFLNYSDYFCIYLTLVNTFNNELPDIENSCDTRYHENLVRLFNTTLTCFISFRLLW